MFASIFCLTELPIEILEQILLHLPGQDIIKMEVISRQFRDLTRNSPTLQHQRDLFSAGLIETDCSPCDFAQRRKLCEEHKRKWSSAGRVVKTTHKLPDETIPEGGFNMILGRNLIAFLTEWVEWWSTPLFPLNVEVFDVYPPDDILAIAEVKTQSVRIHFLNLSDGSAYSAPHSSITWEPPQGVDGISVQRMAITSSRIMIHVHCWEETQQASLEVWRIFVWDWRTGDSVLCLPSADESTPIIECTDVFFLDEFRMMVSTSDSPDAPEFTLFDTLALGSHPASSRRFRVPQEYRGWLATVYLDPDRCLGTLDRDRPLITDPTQAVLVVKLDGNRQRVLIIVRIQTLVGHLRSVGTDGCVPWDEWKGGAVVMEVHRRSGRGSHLFVQGVRVIFVEEHTTTPGVDRQICLSTFDFSRRGCRTLPPDRGDGVERVSHGRDFLLQKTEGVGLWELELLGDDSFVYLDKSNVLHVWELV